MPVARVRRSLRWLTCIVIALGLGAAAVTPAEPAAAATSPQSAVFQVERLYRAYFDRSPEAAGLNYWTGERLRGRPLSDISEHFARSPEFAARYGSLSNRGFIELVYDNVLDRAPDAVGATYWTEQLSHVSRGQVMVGFSESTEFIIKSGHLDAGQVQRLYRAYFLREGDTGGLGYWWTKQVEGMDLAVISETFARSPEFVTRYGSLSDRQFVVQVYRNVLNREPDMAGENYWAGRLGGGLTRGGLMVGFSESPEFSGKPAGPQHSRIGGCQLFPSDSFWFARVDALPVHPRSDAYVNRIGRARHAHPDFGSDYDGTGAFGIPFTVVPGPGPATNVSFLYDNESDAGPYPIPRDAAIERGGDAHILLVETERCVLHEIFAAQWVGSSIQAGSGARWDLASNAMRPSGWTSADAAGLPILPGLVRYDEVAAGSIDHAIRFTAPITDNSFVWPASHHAGTDGVDNPPMGSWVRLKSSVDPAAFTGQARVVIEALRKHGAILADNGSGWYFSGAPDDRWDNDDLGQLKTLDGSMFEFVDASSLQLTPDSMATR